jgi:indole-3-glycerol phosphate synthase
VERLSEAGVHAMLVGESLIRATDIGVKIRELLGTDKEQSERER